MTDQSQSLAVIEKTVQLMRAIDAYAFDYYDEGKLGQSRIQVERELRAALSEQTQQGEAPVAWLSENQDGTFDAYKEVHALIDDCRQGFPVYRAALTGEPTKGELAVRYLKGWTEGRRAEKEAWLTATGWDDISTPKAAPAAVSEPQGLSAEFFTKHAQGASPPSVGPTQDPLQGAVTWLMDMAPGLNAVQIAGRLMIPDRRAARLRNAALGGKV